MAETDWFEIAQGPELRQGDLLIDCPIFAVSGPKEWPLPPQTGLEIATRVIDAVVLTQSCDLANDKVEDVLLGQVIAWTVLVGEEVRQGNQAVKSSRFRKSLVEGNVPSLALLHQRKASPALPWSVVDFHRLFTSPKSFLASLAALRGPRLRLRSPYREHLAQALARYFMRVGLPLDARAFEKEGDVGP